MSEPLVTTTPARDGLSMTEATWDESAPGSGTELRFRGQGVRPARWEEHCYECGAPACYSTCALYDPAELVGCRRFEHGIVLHRDGDSWTGVRAELVFRRWGLFKSKLRGVSPASTWALGFLLQLDVRSRSGAIFEGNLDITPSPWAPGAPQLRVPLSLSGGLHEIYVGPAELQHLAGFAGAEACLSFPEQWPSLLRIFSAHFVTDVIDHEGRRPAAAKLACLDLDHTIWSGEVDEAAPPPALRPGVWRCLERLRERRVKIVAISRASEAAARQRLHELGLLPSFAAVRCEVASKADELERLRAEGGYHPREVLFVDDDPFERFEVEARCPQVTVYDERRLPMLWADPGVSGSTTSMAGQPPPPRATALAPGQLERELEPVLAYGPPAPEELPRCWELLQRTNRLHCVEWRPSLEALATLAAQPDTLLRIGRCTDRAGTYGLVCFAAAQHSETGSRIIALTFSCRISMRLFPDAFVSALRGELKEPVTLAAPAVGSAAPRSSDLRRSLLDGTPGRDTACVQVRRI